MPESGLIRDYLEALSAQLPASVAEELAGGLDQTRGYFLSQGLDSDAAAAAAVAEFGEVHVIVAAFVQMSPARRAARRLLVTGPVVGACWATALITCRAWTWPIPDAARLLLGVALITVIGLLAVAALGGRYRPVGRAGTAGCVGITAIDAAMLVTVALVLPAVTWPIILAGAASAARLTFTARALRTVRTG